MKKTILNIAFILPSCLLFAQEEMKSAWETKLEHQASFASGFSSQRGISYGASEKDFSLIDNQTGQVKWHKKFSEISEKLKKVDELIPMWDANTIFLFDRKAGKDQMACMDINSGSLLWVTDKYQAVSDENVIFIPEMEAFAISLKEALVMVKARSGEEIWKTAKFKGVVGGYIYMNDGNLVMLNYKPSALAAMFSGFKNQLVKINTKNGDVLWDVEYIGVVEKKVYTREPVLKLNVDGGKVFLTMNGLQVYDYGTGALLWACAYDINLSEVVKRPAGARRFGVYDAVAEPLVAGSEVYIVDMKGKSKQYIRKYDLNTGKVIWSSPELEGVRVAPNLYLAGDKLVLQVGGVVETQAYIIKTQQVGDYKYTYYIWRKDYPNVKPCRLMAFSANDGKLIWDSERFKKGITNAFVKNDRVIVCSGKALYNLNLADGKENYEILLADDDIGLAVKIMEYKDNALIIGEKGISEHKIADGSLSMGGKWKDAMLEDITDNYLLMKRENDDIACFNLETCKYKAYNARAGAQSYLSDDGTFIIVFDKKEVIRLATK